MPREKKTWVFNQIFDPTSAFITHWNNLILAVGLVNFYLDPIVMYTLTIGYSTTYVKVDLLLGTILAVLRTLGDLFVMLGIVVKFRTAYDAPCSRVFKRRRLVKEPRQIAVKYLRSTFIIDLLAALPLPQAWLLYQIIASNIILRTHVEDISIYLKLYDIFWFQVLPRLFALIIAPTEMTRRAGTLMKSPMSGAFYNLLWFMTLSNIMGAVYYQLHIYWLLSCMDIVEEKKLDPVIVGWDQLLSNCTQNNELENGIYNTALTNKIATRSFIQRYMFCLSWGIKSFSSLGQNFTTSFSITETTVSIIITLLGLVFFADLITRMQAGIQSMEEREEQQRARQREIKEWMDYHQLPLNLKEHIHHTIQSEWSETGTNDEAMLDSLPMDLSFEIRRYLYMDLVCKLPKFADMDSQLVEAICQHVRTFFSRDGTYIVYEGDLLRQMLFIFSGELEISFRDSGSSCSTILGPGDICGQELVTWASLSTTSLQSLPPSTWTMKCLTDVEAFTLQAYNLKILATQFSHNQEFQRAFKQHYP